MPTTSIKPKRTTQIPFLERFCANNANKCKSKQDLVLYYHHACFCPTKSKWIKAVKHDFFTTWPGLTLKLVTKYLKKSIFTKKGHLHQILQRNKFDKKRCSHDKATERRKWTTSRFHRQYIDR